MRWMAWPCSWVIFSFPFFYYKYSDSEENSKPYNMRVSIVKLAFEFGTFFGSIYTRKDFILKISPLYSLRLFLKSLFEEFIIDHIGSEIFHLPKNVSILPVGIVRERFYFVTNFSFSFFFLYLIFDIRGKTQFLLVFVGTEVRGTSTTLKYQFLSIAREQGSWSCLVSN